MAPPNPARQREERGRLNKLFAQAAAVYVIHYACQSFSQPQHMGSPRIASIAVRNLANGATTSFSIHQELELGAIPRQALDQPEKMMLDKFFQFLTEHKRMTFVHWNMRDVKYGFAALEHRHAVLGGSPYVLPDHQKIDLSMMMVALFGSDYVSRPHVENLARANELSLVGYIKGEEEPIAFNHGQYSAVLQSTLCKVTLIADIAQLTYDGTLKTDATWWTRNVGRVREACELFDRNPVQAWAGLLFAVAAGTFAFALRVF